MKIRNLYPETAVGHRGKERELENNKDFYYLFFGLLAINRHIFWNTIFASFPDVEELLRKEALAKEELRQLQLAATAKRTELGEIQSEIIECERLKSALPSLI